MRSGNGEDEAPSSDKVCWLNWRLKSCPSYISVLSISFENRLLICNGKCESCWAHRHWVWRKNVVRAESRFSWRISPRKDLLDMYLQPMTIYVLLRASQTTTRNQRRELKMVATRSPKCISQSTIKIPIYYIQHAFRHRTSSLRESSPSKEPPI